MSKRLIGVGLALAFLTLILLTVGVGYLGLHTMANLNGEERSIVETEWRDVELADQALSYSHRNAHLNMELLVLDDDATSDSLIRQRSENSARISAIIERLKARVGSERERILLDAVIEGRKNYIASYKHATDLLLKQNDLLGARNWIIRDTSPLMLKYHLAWSEFIRFQTEETNQRLDQSAVLYAANKRKLLYLVGSAILLAFMVAVLVVGRIMREIHRRETAEGQTRLLNEDLEARVLQRTAALEASREKLRVEVAEREAAEEQLRQKNAFLEAQLNSTDDGIVVVDGNRRRILQNQRFKEISRLPDAILNDENHQAALDYTLSRVADPETFRGKVEYLYAHRDKISRDEIEFRDGQVIDRYSAPVLGEDCKYYGRIWVLRDITERKRRERTLRQLSLAVEQSPVSVVITDLAGKIVYVNRKFTECTGYSYEEAIGKNPRILKSGHTSSEEYKQLWTAITSGNEWRGEFHNRKKNGDLYWECALITPIRNEKGAITHFLGLKEDITERRMLQAQLQHAQKLEAIGQLAAGIAHEINTPMQFIGDNTRFVRQAWDTVGGVITLFCSLREAAIEHPELQDRLPRYDIDDLRDLQHEVPAAIEETLDGVGRVSKIVRAMKEFSHPGCEEKQPTDINRSIETTLTVARNEWKYIAEVETFLSPNVGLVPCYHGEFNQVVLNLLVNAAQAIAEVVDDGSHSRGKITIRTTRDPDSVEISIQDTGCGIPPEIRRRIFEPFFTTKDIGKGTGQGLALAHAVVVKKHGGQIWFESELGKGTTFFVRLPV